MVQIKLESNAGLRFSQATLEKIFLIAFFAVFLLIGNGFLFDHRLQHEFPYAYLASDAFQHQTRAQSIKDAGNYRNEASYIANGIEGAIGYYPPVLYHLSVILSHLSGLEVYDTIYFLVFLFAGLASLIMYIIIRQLNRNAAIISLPISMLVFSNGLYTGFTWGHWPALLSQFFLVCIFWYTSRIDLDYSCIFLCVFISAAFMTHTSEALFAVIYLVLFLVASGILKKLDFKAVKNIIFGGIISFAITFYYLVIFKGIWVPRQPFEFAVSRTWDNPTMYLSDFGVFFLFMIAGAVISLFYIKKYPVPALSSLAMLLIGSGNYYGFREKAFQLRFFWPVFLSFFIGFGIYWVLKLAVRNWKIYHSIVVSLILIFIIAPTAVPFIPREMSGYIEKMPFIPHYLILQTSGIMDRYHWEILEWIEKNTEKNQKIYFFYGDIYSQDALLRNSKRTHYLIVPEDYIDAIKKREIRRIYDTELPGDSGGGAPYRKSFFSFGFKLDERPSDSLSGKKDICSFDYYVFDKISAQPVFAEYNLLIAGELQNKGATKVFENPVSIIMKNNNHGDCIGQRNF